MKKLNQKFEKPTIKDIQEIIDEPISEEISQDLLVQIEELSLIAMGHYFENENNLDEVILPKKS
jgi:hypothetical protein